MRKCFKNFNTFQNGKFFIKIIQNVNFSFIFKKFLKASPQSGGFAPRNPYAATPLQAPPPFDLASASPEKIPACANVYM